MGHKMTDLISFLPMLEPRDTSFEDNERIADIRKNYAEYYLEAN